MALTKASECVWFGMEVLTFLWLYLLVLVILQLHDEVTHVKQLMFKFAKQNYALLLFRTLPGACKKLHFAIFVRCWGGHKYSIHCKTTPIISVLPIQQNMMSLLFGLFSQSFSIAEI